MSVALSTPSLYGRRRGTVTKRLERRGLPNVSKSYYNNDNNGSPGPERAAGQTMSKDGLTSSRSQKAETKRPASTAMASTADSTKLQDFPSLSSVTSTAGSRLSQTEEVKVKEFSAYPYKKGTTSRFPNSSSVIDEKYRDSMQRHYRLLMAHIVPTDDVIKHLGEEKILPDTMVRDIQDAETREDKNECLLRCLHLRGNKSFRLFRDLMYRIGNFFVADLLWDEGEGVGSLQEDDLGKFPGLMSCVPESQRKKLINFLEAKIRERALILAWKTSPEERMQALKCKVMSFNQDKTFRETIATQEKSIGDLEDSLEGEKETGRSLRTEMCSLRQELQQVREKHMMAMDIQTRFHDANLSTIARLKERLCKFKESVKALSDAVKRKVDIGLGGVGGIEWGEDGDEGAEDEPKLDALEYNVRKLLFEMSHERERANKGEEQRLEVLKLLNRSGAKEPLVQIVREVLRCEQRHRSLVMRDILQVAHTLKHLTRGSSCPSSSAATTSAAAITITAASSSPQMPHRPSCLPDPATLDTKHFKTELAMLKAEAEHIHKRLQWKDIEIADQQKEIFYLKQRLSEYPPAPSPAGSHSQPSTTQSCSQQSLEQPFHTPVDPAILQEELDAPFAMDHFLASWTPTTPASSSLSQRRSFTPSTEGKMSPKTVTFEDTGAGVRTRGRNRGIPSRERVKADPDKTVVSAEQYLLREPKGGAEEEPGEDVCAGSMLGRAGPSRGEGDTSNNHGGGDGSGGGEGGCAAACVVTTEGGGGAEE